MPFEHHAARRHRIPRARCRVRNWPAYEAGLKRRGDLTLWLDEAAMARWQAPRRTTPGGQAWYSGVAVEPVLMLRLVFHLGLRQAEGFAASVLRLLGQDLRVPDHTTLSRRGRGYAPRGRTPAVRVCRRRAGLSLISAATNKGELRWMVVDGAVNAPTFIRFLERLIRDNGRKVFLVLDRLKAHRARLTRDWLAEHPTEIEVAFLPSYSPELNADEGVNADLKQAVPRKAPARSKPQLKRAVIGHMRRLAKLPRRIRSIFHHQQFRHAA